MQRPYAVDQFKYAVYKLLSFSIAQAPQGHSATKMIVAIGITAWTMQRTLAGKFDGKRGSFSFKNFAPRTYHFQGSHILYILPGRRRIRPLRGPASAHLAGPC